MLNHYDMGTKIDHTFNKMPIEFMEEVLFSLLLSNIDVF